MFSSVTEHLLKIQPTTPSQDSGEVIGVGGSSEIGMFKYGIGEGKNGRTKENISDSKICEETKKQRKKISTLVTEAQYSEPKEPVFIPRMFALHQINRRTKSASNLLKCKN